eukprot:2075496-Rhodomonas_salina.3
MCIRDRVLLDVLQILQDAPATDVPPDAAYEVVAAVSRNQDNGDRGVLVELVHAYVHNLKQWRDFAESRTT